MGVINKAFTLTAPGVAAIAVVRWIGPGVQALLEKHFDKPLRDGGGVHGSFRVGDRVIDDPVVVWDSARQLVDLNLHGGRWVVHEVLEAARVAGFDVHDKLALPLPPEAVDGSSEIQREILQWLPLARTREAVESLLAQESAWRLLQTSLNGEGQSACNRTRLLDDRSLANLLGTSRVVIVGIPNAGKSTLANALFARQRSITADLPGTTRDWVGDTANIDGMAVYLADTPGLRDTDCHIERRAIELSQRVIQQADLVLIALDPTQPLAGDQKGLLEQFPTAQVVITKTDCPRLWPVSQLQLPQGRSAIELCCPSDDGVADLRLTIRRHFGCNQLPITHACCWTPRQRQILTSGLSPAEAIGQIVGR